MILLTGITGKSGRWFLETVADADHPLNKRQYRALVRSSSDCRALDRSGLNVEKMHGDLTDTAFLEKAMKGVSIVLHIAGIQTSLPVVRIAVENRVKWIILVHTTGIFSRYKSAGEGYRRTEQLIGDLVKDSGTATTILRPTMIYGSIDDGNVAVFIRMADALPVVPVVNHANYPLQPVHSSDLGVAYARVLTHEAVTKGRDYILSGARPILLVDMFKVIGKRLGKNVRFMSVPFPLAFCGSWILHLLTFGRVDFRERVQRLVESRAFSHADANKDFGYSPLSFEEGIVNEVEEYQCATSGLVRSDSRPPAASG